MQRIADFEFHLRSSLARDKNIAGGQILLTIEQPHIFIQAFIDEEHIRRNRSEIRKSCINAVGREKHFRLAKVVINRNIEVFIKLLAYIHRNAFSVNVVIIQMK